MLRYILNIKTLDMVNVFFFRWQASVFNLIKILIINSITNKSIEYYKLIASYSDAQFEF